MIKSGDGQLSFKNWNSALQIASALVQEDYVIMISLEGETMIISYVYSPNSDRNDVIFMNRVTHEEGFVSASLLNEEEFEQEIHTINDTQEEPQVEMAEPTIDDIDIPWEEPNIVEWED